MIHMVVQAVATATPIARRSIFPRVLDPLRLQFVNVPRPLNSVGLISSSVAPWSTAPCRTVRSCPMHSGGRGRAGSTSGPWCRGEIVNSEAAAIKPRRANAIGILCELAPRMQRFSREPGGRQGAGAPATASNSPAEQKAGESTGTSPLVTTSCSPLTNHCEL
jgi:hypothetical protein